MFPGTRQALGEIGRSVDVLTYVSRYARDRMMSAFGTAAWEPMPGGVNSKTFTPQPEKRDDLRQRYGLTDKKVIVAVSRIVSRKGQDTLVEAMPRIVREVPEAHLLIVGPGASENLQRRARILGVENAITITGAVDFAELAGHYCVGDVFALPVRTQLGGLSVEGLGIVFLEAQACGVPTVAGNGGELRKPLLMVALGWSSRVVIPHRLLRLWLLFYSTPRCVRDSLLPGRNTLNANGTGAVSAHNADSL